MYDDEVVPESPIRDDNLGVPSPPRDSPIKSNVEVTGGLDGSVKTSLVDTTINQGDNPKVSTPKKTFVTPPRVSNVESVTKEVRTSGILANISHMDANVNMGQGVSNKEAQGPKTVHDDDTTEDGEFVGGKHHVPDIEVDVMLKAQEHRLRNELEILDRNNENRVKAQSLTLNHELKELKYGAR
ncbi:unnamed protein product [Lactuca saligna]|uniref:Uncharacterized protein n=1 Tax=Lactuca saligna TaxID=75948 RepID=A0AA36E3A4_LACSI|nr:unnamed protein product [Lactuca saligna]